MNGDSNNIKNALDTSASCFAFASAGSGKTKLLVDRYVKSLINGIKPSEILCITFTNLAVSEMFNRISSILQELYTQNDTYLIHYLENTLNIQYINNILITNTRSLFIKFQNELNYTKIMTLHSFCKNILNQFPIEADILPGFNIIEQEELNILLQQAKQSYFQKLLDDDADIPFSSYYLNELVDEIFSNTANYSSIFDINNQNILYNKLIIDNLQFNDQQQYIINKYFSDKNLEDVFLTKTGSIRKNIKHEAVSTNLLQDISNTVYNMRLNINKKNLILKTKSLIKIINGVYTELLLLKKQNNVLDFNDIINKTYYLLKHSSYKDYVLLEIAKNIKTILLDEAQDLSTIQWAVLGFFIENCFADILNNKSVFVVGDIKQSIYRFQNANYKAFLDFYNYSQQANKQFNKKLYTVYLDKCYRTLPQILSNIDNIFNKYSQYSFNGIYRNHIPVRTEDTGEFNLINTNNVQEIAQYIFVNKITDALVLFRSRNEFNTNLYYELLRLGLEVAPLDKLCLKDIPIVKNIISLANIAVSSINNNCSILERNLAFILQSNYVFDNPLNNQELLSICYGRQQSLLECLKAQYKDKFNVIQKIIEMYKSSNLIEFFYYIVCHIIRINTTNDNDVLANFMDIVIKYSDNYNENIVEFLDYFNNTEYTTHLQGNNSNCIRFSSIHSAKGLEANNVILLNFKLTADKNQLKFVYKDDRNIFEPYNNEYLFFIKQSLNESCPEIENYINKEYEEESKELFRLLYVALTRARDKLYIFNNGASDDDITAWSIIQKSLICNNLKK